MGQFEADFITLAKFLYLMHVSKILASLDSANPISNVSAVLESDVGDQLVLLSSLAQLQNLDSCPSVSTCK